MNDWLDFEYSIKSVTAHGGMSLLKRIVNQTGILPKISSLGLYEPGSNSGYSVTDLFTSFFVSVWHGANRFSHAAVLQHDKVIPQIFGLKRAPSNGTYRRFFSGSILRKARISFWICINGYFTNSNLITTRSM
jgi:hypothetical protein